ncbi:MAG TPA: DinB family protein [Saprospirales bacterium]|nr:DinB family protein [Saprospirales bacterium]
MNEIADRLLAVVDQVKPLLEALTDVETGVKPDGKWSKKEILGHLIDSACNNQQKFVRTMEADSPLHFVGYAQDYWVSAQGYQQREWREILLLWEWYNKHIAHIIRIVPERTLSNTISINGSQPFTLAFIMEDYIEHLKHHLKQILPQAELESNFTNPYRA